MGVTLLSVSDTDFLEHSDGTMFGLVFRELTLRNNNGVSISLHDFCAEFDLLIVALLVDFLEVGDKGLRRSFKLFAIGFWGGDDLTEFGADIGREIIEVLDVIFRHIGITLFDKLLCELSGFAEVGDDGWEDAEVVILFDSDSKLA